MLKSLTFFRRNAIALVALFVALGGTSYAALNLPARSVGTKQLRNRSVTGRKLARHAVAAANLNPKSIAGHIADWAAIRGDLVAESHPRASLAIPGQGIYRVSWRRAIPARCVAIVTAVNGNPSVATTASTVGPLGQGSSMFFEVDTFGAGGVSTPASFNVIVVCP